MPVTEQNIKDKKVSIASKNVEVIQAANSWNSKKAEVQVLQGQLQELIAQKAVEDLQSEG